MPEELIGVSEASKLVGVSEQALRQWTDDGKIKAFITPGGHRRYSKTELKKFLGRRQKTLGIKDLAFELEETAPAHREMDSSFLNKTPWFGNLSAEAQKSLALLGRSFLTLVIKLVTEPSKKEETMDLVRNAGRDFGETLARLGVPLTDSVQAFIRHREPILGAVTVLMKKRGALSPRVAGTNPLINRAMDEALISLVAAYQEYRITAASQDSNVNSHRR